MVMRASAQLPAIISIAKCTADHVLSIGVDVDVGLLISEWLYDSTSILLSIR